jgi:hypothetical protein
VIQTRAGRGRTFLLATLVLVACNSDGDGDVGGGANGQRGDAWLPPLEAGEVSVLGDYDPPASGLIHSVAVDPEGLVYLMLGDENVWEAVSPSDLDACCGTPDTEPGGIDAVGDTIYIVHTDAQNPVRGVGAYRGTVIEPALTLPVERGQLPGDVAVHDDGRVYLSIVRAEDQSVDGVQVLRATGGGGFEVVAGSGEGCTEQTTPAPEARFTSLTGLAVASDGTAYAADPECGKVYAVTDTEVRVALDGEGRRPVDVAVVGDDVYVADAGTGEVVRSGDGEVVLSADDVPDGFNPDELIALDGTPDGDLVVVIGSRLIGVGLADV